MCVLRPQETASGLNYLHTIGIIHRDIKPGNILIGGLMNTAKIADYGISRVATLDATMTHKGTPIYQAPEVTREERYGFAADIYSLALTFYALCDRVSAGFTLKSRRNDFANDLSTQDTPYSEEERMVPMKLATDIALEGYRPPIRDTWNPAMSFIITSSWSDDASLRPDLGRYLFILAPVLSTFAFAYPLSLYVSTEQIMSFLEMIMRGGDDGLITSSTKEDLAEREQQEVGEPDLTPGALWRRIKTSTKNIVLGDVLGEGSFARVQKGTFGDKAVAVKIFRNTEEEKSVGPCLMVSCNRCSEP